MRRPRDHPRPVPRDERDCLAVLESRHGRRERRAMSVCTVGRSGDIVSQRASFVTEYMYCEQCADAVASILCSERNKYLCATRIPMWMMEGIEVEEGQPPRPLPIIAGKIGGMYLGEEFHAFEFGLNEQVA